MSNPTTTSTVKTRCATCGSTTVVSTLVAADEGAGIVIRTCAGCENRRGGSYVVKTRPRWADAERAR